MVGRDRSIRGPKELITGYGPETAGVISLSPLGQATGYYHLVLTAPLIARESRTRLVMVRCADEQALDPLLAKTAEYLPFSSRRRKNWLIPGGRQGARTSWLADASPGDSLSLLGPLGNGFPLWKTTFGSACCRRDRMPALFSLVEQKEK